MNNLYNFNSNAPHVRIFMWLTGINPVVRFKTMCPYFWMWVAVIITSPGLIIIKGIVGLNKAVKVMNRHNINASMSRKISFIKNNMHTLTPKAAYKIYKSSSLYLSFDDENKRKIFLLAEPIILEHEIKRRNRKRFFRPLNNIIEYLGHSRVISKLFIITFLGSIAIVVFATMRDFYIRDPEMFIVVMLFILLGLSTSAILIFGGIKLNTKLKLFRIFKPLAWILVNIGNFVSIIISMLISTYKQICPIITWKTN